MSAKKEIYLLVKSIIKALPTVKHWDVWNDNVERDGEVDPFKTNAVFFEWTSGSWDMSTEGGTQNLDDKIPNQHGKLQFTLHLVIKKVDTEEKSEIAHYDFENEVYEALHFQTVVDPEDDFIEGKIQRLSDDTILRNNVWRDWPVVYSVNAIECGQTEIGDGLTDAQPVDFDVEPELIIKNKEITERGLNITIGS